MPVIPLATSIAAPVERVRDNFYYESPLGLPGRLGDFFILERYLRSFLVKRNLVIKQTAESDAWKHSLSHA